MSNTLLACFFCFVFVLFFPPVLIVKKKHAVLLPLYADKVTQGFLFFSLQTAMQICAHNVALLAVEKVPII